MSSGRSVVTKYSTLARASATNGSTPLPAGIGRSIGLRNGRRGVLVHKIGLYLALHERAFMRSLCLGCLFDSSLFFSGCFFAPFHLEARDRIANAEGPS